MNGNQLNVCKAGVYLEYKYVLDKLFQTVIRRTQYRQNKDWSFRCYVHSRSYIIYRRELYGISINWCNYTNNLDIDDPLVKAEI